MGSPKVNKAAMLDKMSAWATSLGGQLISSAYTGSKDWYSWRCSKGHEWSALWNSVRWGGLRGNGTWCRLCRCNVMTEEEKKTNQQIRRRRRRERYPLNERFVHLKKTYGLEPNDYDRMLADQNGVCAICSNPPTSRYQLSVDHCHNTGAIRGLLCGRCNRAIGMLEDSSDLLEKASFYLKKSGN